MKRYAFMILFFIATLFLATSAFCQKLRPVTIGLTGKSLATAAFEMSVRRGHFKQEGLERQVYHDSPERRHHQGDYGG